MPKAITDQRNVVVLRQPPERPQRTVEQVAPWHPLSRPKPMGREQPVGTRVRPAGPPRMNEDPPKR